MPRRRSPFGVGSGFEARPLTPTSSSCRVCGSVDVATWTRLDANYASCRECGAITRLLTREEYEHLDVTYDPEPVANDGDVNTLRLSLSLPEKERLLAPLIDRLATTGRRPVRFLDVGCGPGGYLVAARSLGCDAIGVEPDAHLARMARDAFGLTVLDGYYTAAMAEELRESFDVVLLSQVIEHLFDPDEFMELVLRAVRVGGVLLLTTPNARSTVARWSGRWWTMLKPHDHVSLLARESFGRFASLAPSTGHQVAIRGSEYPSEPLAGVVLAWRASRAEPRQASASVRGETSRPWRPERSTWRRRATHALLAAASFPIYAWNRWSGRQACLVVEVTKGMSVAEPPSL